MKPIVIDDFFADPLAEREKALASSFQQVEHNALHYSGIAPTEDPETIERIQKILGVVAPKSTTAFYRTYVPSDKQETFIHNDCMIGTFSAICFLTKPEDCKGGLAFWKHKLLGWEAQPTVEQCEYLGLKDQDEWFQRVYRDGDREDLWEMTDYVPMEFNRLVLFWSPMFHSRYPKDPIGTAPDNARLIKTFFYQI